MCSDTPTRDDAENADAPAHRPDPRPLAAGLYFVSTPIGAARDITLRALDILAKADVLAAEDTRTLKHLMEIHGVPLGDRHVFAYHDHNGEAMRPKLLRALADGKSIAYASEAGTPLIADPGFQLGRAAIADGHTVLSAPGASAVLAALTVSGLPSDRFLFAGFAPTQAGARKRMLAEVKNIPATLIFYESPKRIHRILTELAEHWGSDRQAVVCRELTKRYEEVSRGTLGDLATAFDGRAVKGEIVLLVARAVSEKPDEQTIEDRLRLHLADKSVKDAAAIVAADLALPRRDVYQLALKLAQEDEE
ncbi:16S rRNA (cytidine1402-2'-O)-methyltransferase [Pseudorhodobacter antarcticus]|jgi:16S rRNA (cytidine1402-2'-O)-methyltransferase|uniref:Ribosomal RNA small subunit methyltransferase I n=1 Tax=Pseudorhodobacter antarcticus TaxID=1077947 RepID=A0A1H8FYY3_9RHOB|nr:16S rRNA (cytidine(1402)-2'-O)-methyltransferase [Pseudorhodobacter antarcticus]SEN37061.1 16S rRNA (cytidine1402-2'-O)-methyltransferase [Pseudorhodobacter antarcticus]